jgi:hypothetical protein
MVLIIRHTLADACLVEERPYGQLLQDSDPGEDVEVVKFGGLFLLTKRIALGRFCMVLSSRIFGEDFCS